MDAIKFFDGALDELTPDMQEVYSLMGYGNHIPDEGVLQIIREVLNDLQNRITLRYGYVLVDGEVSGKGQLRLGNSDFSPGLIIAHAMKGADYYALFTVTIGEGFDDYVRKLKQEDDILRVFVADAVGSILAETTVSLLMDTLKREAEKEGMAISNNYSPGYCNWHLSEQTKLFRFFPEGITGIHLTESCLMLPVKSVSGIVAIGKNVKKRAYGCDICNMSSCIKNKKKKEN
ncbi:vitamin B12 dependent-methionine synthase activation domain-containing protein [Bacteroides sp.]|uniref:vitamin B12 dependent-methionine synthase activation domain-containing protein n=1 Tax=Bacteroides sp. TaxID=29523 RepID=UPI003AB84D40